MAKKTAPGKQKKSKSRNAAPKEPVLRNEGTAEVLSSEVVYKGPLFQVRKEEVREPNGHVGQRDVIAHSGSVVILALDSKGRKRAKDPLVIMERQYRHAAGQYLWELPAGKIDPGEERLPAAQRELTEETGYAAGKWTELVRYYASPGFLSEWMQIFLAEELTAGVATPEADETLEIYSVPLSIVEEMAAAGQILDGKTLIALGAYRRLRADQKKARRKKK
jgi:ADP-ribose pyrophosphatase